MQSIKKLADEALSLSNKFEHLPQAIYQTLDNHKIQGDDRTRFFREIMSEFKRRKEAKATTKRAAEQARSISPKPSLPKGVTTEMMFEARAHELRQPKESYDADRADEIANELGLPPRG